MTNLFRLLDNPPFGGLFPYEFVKQMDEAFRELDVFRPEALQESFRTGFPKGESYTDKGGNKILELAMAGYSKDQLSLEVDDNMLTITAEKCEDGSDGNRVLARRAFKRTFYLGDHWDLPSSEVVYKDGLLKVVVPPKKVLAKEAKILEIK